jgi:endonuclease/exonuclease/phosphatase family metal-dependent hydrolase
MEFSVRLLSYNIHKGIGGRDRRYRLQRIIEAIQAEAPDIVCLQEVDRNVSRSRFDNQPALLADWFQPAAHLFQFNVKVRSGGYGNLLLSRWAFRTHHQISLTRHQKKPRGAQLAVIESPAGPFHLTHWHLGLSERERNWQTRHLLEHHLYRESQGLPSLIVGDFNDWRNQLAAGPFLVHGFRQATSPPSRFRSFPAWMPVWSLDKAFYRGAMEVTRVHIVRGRSTRDASDHLPLVIDFHLIPDQATP